MLKENRWREARPRRNARKVEGFQKTNSDTMLK